VLHQHRRISLPLPDPLFFLLPRARSLERRTGDLTPRRCPVSSRTEVPPLPLPRQEHHQHHISMSKLPDQFPFAFLHSDRRNTIAALRTSPRRLCSSRTAASELPFYDSNYPQVRCELLNLFPHLFLAAGEPPCRILIAATRLLLFKSIRDPVASLCLFLGSFL
jgi:hypothetical protein